MSKSTEVSGWVHFGPLRFLEDVLDRKQIELQILSGCCDIDRIDEGNAGQHCEIIIEEDDRIEIIDDDDESREISDFQNDTRNENQKQKKQEQQQQNRPMRECDLAMATTSLPSMMKEEDENVHFFKSLLPYFRVMDMTSKLRVRIEIQKMLLEELSSSTEANRCQTENNCDDKRANKKNNEKIVAPTRTSSRVVKKNRKYFRK